MHLKTRLKTIQPILIALLVAAFLRTWAVSLLPQDFDEPVYLQTAFDYADLLKAGNINGVIDYPGAREHPAFVKLLYGGVVLALGKAATWTNAFYASRTVSALFGVLAVVFVTLAVDPLAGGMLAVNTLAVKYTSQVYLEAVPHAMTIAAVLAFLRVEKDKPNRWLWLSAVALGAATASKYSYIPVILIVLGYLALFEKKVKWHLLMTYAIVTVVTFFLLDVTLWHQPFQRLYDSLFFHVQYSQGTHVQEVGYPWYQPFIWIFTSAPAGWHPNVFFYYGFDGIISILAVAGLKREWQNRRWLVVWLAFGVLFLLLWPTKWPQYALSVTPALCIMAAESARRFWKWLREKENYWDYLREMLPTPSKWLWIGMGIFAFFIAAVYLSAAVKLAVGRIGWSQLTAQSSFLPGNTVYDLLPEADGKMVIATDKGAAIWAPPETTDQPGHWTVFNHQNSGLLSDQVFSLARDPDGHLWFGTTAGVAEYNGETWTSFRAADLGLPDEQVLSLAATSDGQIYAGTLAGASVWSGASWTPIPPLAGQTVFALTAGSDSVWAGTSNGAGRLKIQSGAWTFYPTENAVKHILVDSSGQVWAATSGSGLARLDGTSWIYLTTSNSDLPLNTVNWVAEIEPGKFWVATSLSTLAGGAVATFDGKNWHTFMSDNSGTSGAEPLVIVLSSTNQVWMGTRMHGIDLYKLGR